MNKMTKLLALVMVLCMATVAMLAGCSSPAPEATTAPEDAATAAPEDAATAAPEDTSAPVEQPDDKTLVIGVEANFEEKWNPFYAESAYDQQVIEQIFVSPQRVNADNVLVDWAGNISYVENEDGTVLYTVKINEGMTFSDGEPITIDDLLFYYKVVSDPSYTGPITFIANDIAGLKEYYYDDPNYSTKVAEIDAEVAEKYSPDTISKEDFIAYLIDTNLAGWWDGNPAGEVDEDYTWSDYITDEGFGDQLAAIDATDPAAMLALLAEVEYTNYADSYDPATYYKSQLEQAYIQENLEGTEHVEEISGIQRVDDYTCTILFNSINIYGDREVNGYLVPEHYYGKDFTKGDVSSIAANMEPMGSGPYMWGGYADNIATCTANVNYFEGVPKIGTVKWQYIPTSDTIAALASGEVDIAVPNGTKDNVQALEDNGLIYHLTDNAGYGYMGLQANNLELSVRKGLLSLMNRESSVRGYYGDLAQVIERPMTTVLSEYPDDAAVYYEYDPEKALEYFQAAGYEQNAEGKLVNADGEQLVVNVYIGGEGSGDHPAYAMLTQAANDMATLGGELQIQDVAFNVLQSAMNDGTADMFILAWGNTTTCDKSSIYMTGGGQNRTNVSDAALDELLAKITVTIDFDERCELVSQMLDKVMDLAVELPLYQRKNIIAYNETNLVMDTIPEASTFWDYTDVLWQVEMK